MEIGRRINSCAREHKKSVAGADYVDVKNGRVDQGLSPAVSGEESWWLLPEPFVWSFV
jgi:hypothetical protein